MRTRIALFAVACLTGLPLQGAAATPQKKIIEWGWDTTNASYIRDHIREIEKAPFDGLVLQWSKVKKDGKTVQFEWECFGKHRFERDDVAHAVQVLKDIKFRRFTDNFLRFNVTPGDVDWFDDFGSISHNARLWADVARDAGMKGWMFDVEPYRAPLFLYRKLKYAKEKTFEEYAEQVRLRGRWSVVLLQTQAYGTLVPDARRLLLGGLEKGRHSLWLVLPDGKRSQRRDHGILAAGRSSIAVQIAIPRG